MKTDRASAFDLPEIHEARALLAQAKYAKADTQLERALEIAKFAVGEQSTAFAGLLELKADCKFGIGRYSESASLYQQCLSTFLKASKFDDARRVLQRYVASVLRMGSLVDISKHISFARSLGSTSNHALTLEILLAKLQILSLEYHQMRMEQANTAMETLEKEIGALVTSVEKEPHPTGNVDAFLWQLSLGRWYQTLYDLRREDSMHDLAKQAYEEALKVSGPKRLEDLIRADALLGLGDLARLSSKWEEAHDYYNKSVDLTDQYFDRDSTRVRHVIEREAVIQFQLKRWIHAEGLLRRLIDYYNSYRPITEDGTCSQLQFECMESYVKMMDSRGRTGEAAVVRTQLDKVKTIIPSTTYDPNAF